MMFTFINVKNVNKYEVINRINNVDIVYLLYLVVSILLLNIKVNINGINKDNTNGQYVFKVSIIMLVKSNAWSAKPIVENENGTENNLKNTNCTS